MKPTLTNISIVARKIIRYGIYLIILILIVRFAYNTGSGVFRQLFPAAPPPPTVGYGRLPHIPFPEKQVPDNLSFSLETVEGELPEFTGQLKIFYMPKAETNIKALEAARKTATSLGFSSRETELVESVYVFEHKSAPSKLTLNIVTSVFSISYDLASNPYILGRIPPSPEDAFTQVNAFIASAQLLPEDLTGPPVHNFLRMEAGEFKEAVSLSESDIIKINLYRKNYEEDIPTVTPDFIESNVWFMLTSKDTRTKTSIIAGEYHYYPVDEKEFETYPIKTAQQAWDELTNGKAYIANMDDVETDITIRRVYLAYYDAGQYTEFLQPVVVFEGDNDFAAYIPAITDEYFGSETN